ncbi:MAG: esterase-like activity of phytase family protein [Alphaproteobacteria bacterium]
MHIGAKTVMMRALAGLLLLLAATDAGAAPIAVTASPVPFTVETNAPSSAGALVWRGTLHLTAPNARFGGYSGLLVSRDGARATLVSDAGTWLNLELLYDEAGRLAGVGGAEIGALWGRDGAPLAGKTLTDAESLARDPAGGVFVAFERAHRVWRYAGLAALPGTLRRPPGIAGISANKGLEALTTLGDGRLLAIAEGSGNGASIAGWLWARGVWARVALARTWPFLPTGAATLPGGDVLLLERHFSRITGVAVRLSRIAAAGIRPGAVLRTREIARLSPPDEIDNMEGIDARRGANGETLIYLVADDNFSALQRTLLMMFALTETRPPE